MRKTLAASGLPRGLAEHRLEFLAAMLVLLLGTSVYVFGRPADAVSVFGAIGRVHRFPGIFGPLGDSLPTFAHVFSLSVLTAVWLGGSKRACLAACLAWFTIDAVFEVGQHPSVADSVIRFIPAWFEHLPILERADGYFLAGTFDPWDLFSIAAGTIAAYLMTAFTKSGENQHE